ncbi:LGT_TIGR03299, phage/plasmid-like protein TIGR03299 [uncultured Caudovirales phage]|uniref:LGT_TIGR03299, phage/plasmid-like protein TIGR03299 n=1 Tax=uncultured Caudovirales phage TaxID=2100421 RepID=A0A6J5NUP4_9CAUD|nr:LGT_TIGR03299, phage/plasmid-like protein TIGR03299 [uncultured Caudovirales phage]
MAHEIEFVDGVAQMAYVGDVPWHGLGVKVPNDLTPDQILEKAGLDWTVEKIPAYAEIAGKKVSVGKSALVRNRDNKVLDVVSDDWNPVQNQEAFEFFNEFVATGDMEMHTAGSLKGGQIVWGLAKVKESFELFKGDRIDSYLLFSNFHKYGFSTDVRFTPIRVVCNNTLSLSLNSKVERMAKISHRKIFKPESVKEMLGIATDKLAKYKDMASFLGSKRAKDEDIVEYFTRIFPVTGNGNKDISKNAEIAMDILYTQPGAEYAEGTWWQPFNAVTYLTDHLAGRSADTRLTSAWYGQHKNLKTRALELAVEMAEAA